MDLKEARLEGMRRHPWEIARARTLAEIAADVPLAAGSRVLDVGCGDGFTAAEVCRGLRGEARWVGVDPALTEEEISALLREYPRAHFVRNVEEVEAGGFGLLLLLDVLEHVADDLGLLRRYVEHCLRADGYVLVTVPAFQSLFAQHDRFLAHYRRYRWGTLEPVLVEAGLEPVRWGYLFASLLPMRGVSVLLEKLGHLLGKSVSGGGIGAWSGGDGLTEAISGSLTMENRLLLWMERRGVRLPGLSVWALCRRKVL